MSVDRLLSGHRLIGWKRFPYGYRVGLEFIRTSVEEQTRLESFVRSRSRIGGKQAAWTEAIVVVGASGD